MTPLPQSLGSRSVASAGAVHLRADRRRWDDSAGFDEGGEFARRENDGVSPYPCASQKRQRWASPKTETPSTTLR
jgi:hypothetical protein